MMRVSGFRLKFHTCKLAPFNFRIKNNILKMEYYRAQIKARMLNLNRHLYKIANNKGV